MPRRLRPHRAGTTLTLVLLVLSAFALIVAGANATTVAPGAPANSLLYDDFARDANLNTSVWQMNGPVGSAFGPDDIGGGVAVIPLQPSFSSKGMEIAQANSSAVFGTIQSNKSFAPPFTATAVVEGTVSNGHTFGFALASTNASTGVTIYGNLNPTNCSHLGDCNDTAVCGIPANSAIPSDQCYYGIDAKIGQGGASWGNKVVLYGNPSVNVTYTLQISVSASGSAQFSVSQGGGLLGQGTAQVGTGPFYVIIEQAEGAPVAHPGPNQAYWFSVGLTSGTTAITTTSTQPGPAPAPAGIPWFVWLIIVAALGILFLIVLLWYRRRGFTVTVLETRRRSPIPEASVMAKGPEKLSGTTDKDGKVSFGKVDEGEYTVSVTALGYNPSTPVTVKVKKKTEYTEKLDRGERGPQMGGTTPPTPGRESVGPEAGNATPATGTAVPSGPQAGVSRTPEEGGAPAVAPSVTPPSEGEGSDEFEGWGGGRIGQIVKTFREKGAVSPETALTAEELGLSRLFVRIMKRRKGKAHVFVEINGRYYLNEKALREL
ncbi:MAG TPA: carboxypeptidase regulatory-like domain-containing protein [Nitrososphaerales archaeon]|nr:carboxypeptidase regulatory-like domain-containing protein [Nitrososphaerales archaeon]